MHGMRLALILGAALAALIAVGCSPSGGPASDNDWQGKNVLLISLDTLRSDRLPPYGGTVETPAISSLASEGIVFDDAVTLVPLTLPSHATILTGLHTIQHGVRDNFNGVLSEAATTLPELFQQSGYETAGVIGAILLSRRTGLSQGFDVYEDEFEPDAFREFQPVTERKASRVVDLGLSWLNLWKQRGSGKPFFLFVHLYDPHHFYNPPAPFDQLYQDSPYNGEIAYADAELKRLFAFLIENRLYDETAIVFIGDHGEGLGDHNEKTHGMFLYEPTVHVPFIVKPPASQRHRLKAPRNDAPVSLADIAPTLAELCGLGFFDPHGQSQAHWITGAPAPREELPRGVVLETQYPATFNWSPLYALRKDGWKYIHAPRPELYHIAEDPAEAANLVDSHPGRAADMDAELQQRLVELAATASFTPELQVSTQRSELLASLGYVSGGGGSADDSDEQRPDPKDKIAVYDLIDEALVMLGKNQTAGALERFQHALEGDPENPAIHLNLGIAYSKMKRWDETIASIERAIELAPGNAILYLTLAKAQISAGKLDDARARLEAFIDEFPKQADAHFQLGGVAMRQNRPAEALQHFETARRWMPDMPGIDKAIQQAQEKMRE